MPSLVLVLLLLLFGASDVLKAQEPAYTRDSYRDTRLLGRGNAGLADVSGGISAFYNPAALAKTATFSFTPVDLAIGANQNIGTSFSEILSLTSSEGTLSERFAPLLGKPLGLQGTLFPHIAVPGFMIGFYDYFDTNIEYRDPVFPVLELDARNDWGVIFGGARELPLGIMVGFSARYMRRRIIEEDLSIATAFNLTGAYLQEIMAEGEAFGVNLGVLKVHKLNSFSSIAAGLTIEDAGYTGFKNSDRGALPVRQAMKWNTGLTYKVKSSVAGITVAADFKDLKNTDLSFSKKVHLGTEVDLPLFNVRGGFFQGYWSAGVTITAIPFMDLDFTTYGEELDSAAGLRQARYWLMGIRMGLDLSNKKKKKKQRFTLDHL